MKRWRHFAVAVGIMPALAIYVGAMVWLSTFIIEIHFLKEFRILYTTHLTKHL